MRLFDIVKRPPRQRFRNIRDRLRGVSPVWCIACLWSSPDYRTHHIRSVNGRLVLAGAAGSLQKAEKREGTRLRDGDRRRAKEYRTRTATAAGRQRQRRREL
mmetsp:Transcript_15762/g.38870  ORF Transcript_15762/g.38870 Transcript_15762/m.38870 type:complete len:102 (-) Transcript_15762:24-329(-)